MGATLSHDLQGVPAGSSVDVIVQFTAPPSASDFALTLDQMDGVIAGVAFGDGEQQGQWQLAYRRKLMTTDTSWQAIADASSGLTLSDRRSQVLKANYNVRNWWRLGVAAFVEDRFGDDAGSDP